MFVSKTPLLVTTVKFVPVITPPGIGGEIFTMRTLEQAWQEAIEPSRREHVTSFIYQQPERFRCAKLG